MKLSVIVAVYNVEKYIEKCLNSLVNQTYKDIEIIVVNDGSTDKSIDIIEKYHMLNNNIIVINKVNGGLSSARNAGIDVATGDYIGFVDGDDYVEYDMYDFLANIVKKNKCEIAICGFIEKYIDHEKKSSSGKKIVMNKFEGLKNLIEGKIIRDFAWNKIYKKSLFKNIRYPIGKLYEDMFTTYRLFDQCNKIVYVDIPKYYYVQRSGSITKAAFTEKQLDQIIALDEFYNYILKMNYTELKHNIKFRILKSKCFLLYQMLKNKVYNADNSFDDKCKVLINEIKSDSNYLFSKETNNLTRIMILISVIGFNNSCLIMRLNIVKRIILKRENLVC